MDRVNITIVGAGVIGLAIGFELSKFHKDILIIEKNPTFGQEISSRNSEVIHAGIYYPKDSLKAKTCIEGRELLYAFCQKNNISHKKIGKLIVATDEKEISDLEKLFKRGLENGVCDLKFISRDEVKKIEPNIRAGAAIFSPSTGIIDSHSLMKNLAWQFQSYGGQICYNTELMVIEKAQDGFGIRVKDNAGEIFKFFTRVLINCAGLNSNKVAQLAGINNGGYKLKFCKGDYFRVNSSKAKMINHLIYPVPTENETTLGTHATLDLSGGLRLGPDKEYVDKIYYDIDERKQEVFFKDTHNFLPFIELRDLSPDTSGIRPKLQGPKEGFRDFVINEETNQGLPNLINLIGIESPGLTSSFSIAKLVKKALS